MMCRLATSILIAACLGASAAGAVETPRPGSADPRIKTIDYDPQQVVRIVGVFRTATQIRFAAEESILHVALGDTSAWEVAAETNILFAKPTVGRSPTNLIVTTRTANGETRHYTFELTTRSGPTARNAPDTFFVVQFRYPQAERAKVQAALSAEAQVLEQRVLQLKLERAVLAGPRNLAYALQGSAAIAPSEVTDNGRFTVLRFPGAQPVPAVYVVAADGSEALVPFDVRGEFLVVHQTAAQLRLRKGREVLCIFNLAFQPAGRSTGTATAAPDVDRTTAGEPSK
ncbi:TrbG/VirB9 family P-type conjugative transfer protein [Phenylobacterium sp. RIFCSPHIGHO2_01_FULL_69_31]|uniref:TrbG/VirB9 family P-type conjugative transfer protein n=1 Tax=Phenylobacterium sp. RIFCSPHIGHO2_01_FULL_69_31 TaxID=1801944 RepID=UPI000A6899A6|nr:TrbG/VirB9 family P-type conjugative transfer protein [Phenylobacterium sp. RIFCSPHIGHO2_01_FULL_69_31]